MPRFQNCWRCDNTVKVGVICSRCGIAKYCSEKCRKEDVFHHGAECTPVAIVRTCTECHNRGRDLRACTRCYQAFYCDSECQRKNWGGHKLKCNQVKKATVALAKKMLDHFSSGKVNSGYYYWGNKPAFDCLNLLENEGEDYNNPMKVLYLGVGDLRNVAFSCASLPGSGKNILFTLNDKASCVLARLVLLLYMLIEGEENYEKIITEIWYSISLSQSSYIYLTKTLKKLCSIINPEELKFKTGGRINIKERDFAALKHVWQKWLHIDVVGTKWIFLQREHFFKEFSYRFDPTYVNSIPRKHATSARKFIRDGLFRRTDVARPSFAENPTLTGPFDEDFIRSSNRNMYVLAINYPTLPFFGWDYLLIRKYKSADCLVTMFGEYVEHILRRFKENMWKHQIRFDVDMCDCMNIKDRVESGTQYDRILTSNLMDYILLPSLLKVCSELLNHSNSFATIVTETLTWCNDFMPPFPFPPKEVVQRIALADVEKIPDFELDHMQPYIVEYVEDSADFVRFLRALFHANSLEEPKEGSKEPKLPLIKNLGCEFNLRLRDFLRNENTLIFFKLAANIRTVTSVDGDERFLEWCTNT